METTDRKPVQTKTADAKKELILQAALEVFSKKGFYAASIDDIIAVAGIGKGTVYRYFDSKQALFLGVLEWGVTNLKEAILAKTKNIENIVEKLRIGIITHLSFFEKHRNFYRVLIQEINPFRENVEKKFKERYLAHFYLLEKQLQRGMEQGLLKKINPGSAAQALLGMTNALIYKWLMSNEDYSLQKEADVIMEIFFKGILIES